MRTPSIRLRLTLWYTAVLLVIQMAVSSGVFLFMRIKLEAMAQSELESGYFERLRRFTADASHELSLKGRMRTCAEPGHGSWQKSRRRAPGHTFGPSKTNGVIS